MSSIGESILMALTVTVNKLASSNVQAVAVHRRQSNSTNTNTATSSTNNGNGRRGLLLSTMLAASQITDDSRTQLLKKYLKKSEENKAKNDKERMDSYYKRNYKDYFEFEEGGLRARQGQLSEAEKGILDWLQKNR